MMSSFGPRATTPSHPETTPEAPAPAPEASARPEPDEVPAVAGPAVSEAPAVAEAAPSAFLEALAELLRSRDLPVPDGLLEAPPQAYAGQGDATVLAMSRLKDGDLLERARKVAAWRQRQADRAVEAWETSPLIAELRRRGLAEPPRPAKAVGAAFSLKNPLVKWTDAEILAAVAQWIKLAGG